MRCNFIEPPGLIFYSVLIGGWADSTSLSTNVTAGVVGLTLRIVGAGWTVRVHLLGAAGGDTVSQYNQ